MHDEWLDYQSTAWRFAPMTTRGDELVLDGDEENSNDKGVSILTYKLNPEIEKIKSPVILVLPDGSKLSYNSGIEACNAVFDRSYVVDEIRAEGDVVVVKVITARTAEGTTWVGEEQSFF